MGNMIDALVPAFIGGCRSSTAFQDNGTSSTPLETTRFFWSFVFLPQGPVTRKSPPLYDHGD